MRKSTICYILCAVFLIAGCNSSCEHGGDQISTPANDLPETFIEDEDSSEQGGNQIYIPVSVLAKAFMEDEDVRDMFNEVAHAIIDLPFKPEPSHFTGEESEEEEEYCFGEETAAVISRLRELFPGYSDNYRLRVGRRVEGGMRSVEFTILLRHENFVGKVHHAEDQYTEFLIYSPNDLSDLEIYGYKKIDENWYSRFMHSE